MNSAVIAKFHVPLLLAKDFCVSTQNNTDNCNVINGAIMITGFGNIHEAEFFLNNLTNQIFRNENVELNRQGQSIFPESSRVHFIKSFSLSNVENSVLDTLVLVPKQMVISSIGYISVFTVLSLATCLLMKISFNWKYNKFKQLILQKRVNFMPNTKFQHHLMDDTSVTSVTRNLVYYDNADHLSIDNESVYQADKVCSDDSIDVSFASSTSNYYSVHSNLDHGATCERLNDDDDISFDTEKIELTESLDDEIITCL